MPGFDRLMGAGEMGVQGWSHRGAGEPTPRDPPLPGPGPRLKVSCVPGQTDAQLNSG